MNRDRRWQQTRRTTSRSRRRARTRSPNSGMAGVLGFLGGLFITLIVISSIVLLVRSVWQPEAEAQHAAGEMPLQPTVTPTPPGAIAPLVAPVPTSDLPGQGGAPAVDAPPAAPVDQNQAPVPPNADPEQRAQTQAIAASIDTYIRGLVDSGLFSGAVLVAQNGTVILSKGYGMAHYDQNIANTPQTRFRLASLTKPLTALAVVMLHERGQLNIHDPICGYLESCPPAWEPITIRHLLTHTSGIPNYTDFIDFATTEMLPATPDDLIMRFRDLPLGYEPGSLYYYNNSGYVLLGVIIERASGQSYEAFLQENIFAPLQMNSTGYDRNAEFIQEGQALGYVTPGQQAPFIDVSTLHGAGSLYSTVEDMYAFDQALYSRQLVSGPMLEEMFSPTVYAYGYGWKLGTLTNGRRVVSHPGYINGFSNYIARYPDDGLFIIVLSNLEVSSSATMSNQIAQFVFGTP